MKVKDLKQLLDKYDDDLEVYIQERVGDCVWDMRYSMCNLQDFNVAEEDNEGKHYLAVGDTVPIGSVGYHPSGETITTVVIHNLEEK